MVEEETEAIEERVLPPRGRAPAEERETIEVAELPPPRPLSGAEFGALVERIRAASAAVHQALGAGLHELAYQRALEVEFNENQIPYLREVKVPISYKGQQIDTRSVDFLIDGVQIEVKARSVFEPADQVQATSYLRASGYERGVILNFGVQLAVRVLGEVPPELASAAEPAPASPAQEEEKPKHRRVTRRKTAAEPEAEEMP